MWETLFTANRESLRIRSAPRKSFFSRLLHRPRILNFKRLSMFAECCVFVGISDLWAVFEMASTQLSELRSNLFYQENGSIEITVVRRFNRNSVGLGIS